MCIAMYWGIIKERTLSDIKSDVYKMQKDRKLKNQIIIDILTYICENKNQKLVKHIGTINPLNTAHGIVYILDHYYILNEFPEEKRMIKNIILYC